MASNTSMVTNSIEDYNKAYKAGKKEYQSRMMRGEVPTLEVLDEILPPKGSYSEVPLGLVQIPADQIVGTRTGGRSSAFAANFMPILRDNTEFAAKWKSLCTSHQNEGIRDPIKAYEYMNKFYVEEGNKRVSVLKYFDAVAIPGIVTRILPPRTAEKENRIYYEFVDFYNLSGINYTWFTKLGSFARLQAAIGKAPDEIWTDDDKLNFSSVYNRFAAEFEAKGGKKLNITTGDAFLAFIGIYGYESLSEKTTNELRELVIKSWEEFSLRQEEDEIDLKMDPTEEKASLLNRLLPISSPKLKIAFVYEKTPTSSAWTYAHELGRLHLEETFPEEVSTLYYENVTQDNVEETIEKTIASGCNIVFTTTPTQVQASVKAAIAHPNVKILNCSLNTSHRYIRNYYARMHEAKFLMGAIAGAMTENDRLGYLADYPILGSIANINAFALGAKMINPRAEVYLEWTSKKGVNAMENFKKNQVSIISGKDMVIPEEASRFFGLYSVEYDFNKQHSSGEHKESNEQYSSGEDTEMKVRNLAMPVWHWGKFYERLIRTIMDGTWKYDDNTAAKKAINYWWGMSAGVIDVICSQNLPIGTKRLVDLLKSTILSGEFNPFSGILYSQKGLIQDDPNRRMTPEEIVTMDWLAENVIGEIPKMEELQEEAKPVTAQQGVEENKPIV